MELNASQVIAQLAQLSATVGFIWWLTKKNADKIEKLESLVVDVAVIKTQVLTAVMVAGEVKDHDRHLVRVDEKMRESEKDINALHQKHRDVDQAFKEMAKELSAVLHKVNSLLNKQNRNGRMNHDE